MPRLLCNQKLVSRLLQVAAVLDISFGYWLAVKELQLNYDNPETILFTIYIYPYSGNLT